MTLAIGDPAPEFTAETDGGEKIQLTDFRGKNVVLYFYPRDNTPGCTIESCDFRDAISGFQDRNTVVLGVSPDSVQSHDKFKAKYKLPFPLISDANHAIAKAYGTWREKSMMGKNYMGIVRSTFVIGTDGKIAAAYDKVKVRGHISKVLNSL